jgi:hypothetical protein
MLEDFSQQRDAIEEKRAAVYMTLRIPEESDVPPEPSKHGKRKRAWPDIKTNVGRAMAYLKSVYPRGLTLLELIEMSAEKWQVPFVSTSIGSQLRYQIKGGNAKKEGEKYYAIV